jgi:hypothetical protein
MRTYELTWAVLTYVDGKEQLKHKHADLQFPSTADDITMRQWTDFQVRKAKGPAFILDLERMSESARKEAMDKWEETHWAQFFGEIAETMATVVNVESGDLLRSLPAIADGQTSLLSLWLELSTIINGYSPKTGNTFDWKSHTYIWPQTVVDSFGNNWYGQTLTTAQAIEALQTEHVYNAKDENGNYALEDRKYHVDITLLAVLSRRVKQNDEVEELPLDFVKRRDFIERRVKEFADIPMTVALDMAFFLTSSKIASALTRISSTLSTPMPTT